MNLKKLVLLIPVLVIMLGSCNNVPDHSKYIPEDAGTVVSINTKELTKDVAWSVFKGSELYKKMKGRKADTSDGFKFDKSGIDILNTSYFYVKPDARYGSKYRSGTQMVALIPLKSETDWEAEMKRLNPNKTIEEVDGRKQLMLNSSTIAIWKKDLLVITSKSYNMSDEDFKDAVKDIFSNSKSLGSNKKFKDLQAEHHDISVFINYEIFSKQMMDQAGSGMGMLTGLTMYEKLFKDAVATAGIDFEDGKIVASSHYYPSKEMEDISKDFYKKVDKDFLDHLPKDNTNAIAGLAFSPEGLLKMIDLMGVKGLINSQLGKQGLSVEEVAGAFTGDIVVSVNNFRSVEKPNPYAAYYSSDEPLAPYYGYEADYLYAMKLKDKSVLQKVANIGGGGMLDTIDNETYQIASGSDTVAIILNDNFLVVSNRIGVAKAFANGDYKGGSKSEGFKYVENADLGAYVDIKSMLGQVKGKDEKKLKMVQGLLNDFRMQATGMNGSASESNAMLTFQNEEENSLLQIINVLGQID